MRYWSCSKFANWLRGTPKLDAGTAEEWNEWKKRAKTKKLRYWLAEEGLDNLQSFICWPINQINNIRFYINNRWITKTHLLTSNLKRGGWHELDERILHCIFNELVNFVEIELAWMNVAFSKEEQKKYQAPWYRTIFRIRVWRCPEAGIAYLKWASELKNDENWADKKASHYNQFTYQELAAQDTLKLYKWWKEERPNRPDPSEASGWSTYCEENPQDIDNLLEENLLEADERKREILNLCQKIEEEQEKEDTNMLTRLIQIRKSLWT